MSHNRWDKCRADFSWDDDYNACIPSKCSDVPEPDKRKCIIDGVWEIPFARRGNKWRLMAEGNAKLFSYTFDLPQGKYPHGACCDISVCGNDCYVRRQMERGARPEWVQDMDLNFLLVEHYPDVAEDLIIKQIEGNPYDKRPIRIHTSGDFYKQDYFEMWARIAERFPDRLFWAPTKCYHAIDFSGVPGNLNVMNSLIYDDDGTPYPNYGNTEYLKMLEEHGAFICPEMVQCSGVNKSDGQRCHNAVRALVDVDENYCKRHTPDDWDARLLDVVKCGIDCDKCFTQGGTTVFVQHPHVKDRYTTDEIERLSDRLGEIE